MVKFNRHNVSNGTTKARATYSLDNRTDGRACVTIYAKGYSDDLGAILPDVENNTDTMTDYFEKDRVRLFEGHPLYAQARARAQENDRLNNARWAAKRAKWEAKRAGLRLAA